MNIIWYDTAREDLDNIYEFYFPKGVHIATRIYNLILDEIEILRTHPYMAAVEPYLKGREYIFRSLIIKDGIFKVVYFVDGNNIVITRIWCCRANPRDLA
ncbi:plasmid stabilization system protein ParE [Parabacteroides sp. PFB2-12]|uniref:type II toxin-antitoxin system RelE/ParE family toxin n=1 Tax=unclassified Parabacteroides TaxID=2649774 RepID=UPI002473F755|nr:MULTISPECIES: type II toxin-antitoxin system RelE/ParE family toxin [unclassified Parabacteroides]MDH6342245.1 plasmid stabilization system protein ParE [Parabacteroides sp. PM6-13]MDH6390588.1 plasmid stabilization system protein ParE [Parabacteroides sp. PFB2-12]